MAKKENNSEEKTLVDESYIRAHTDIVNRLIDRSNGWHASFSNRLDSVSNRLGNLVGAIDLMISRVASVERERKLESLESRVKNRLPRTALVRQGKRRIEYNVVVRGRALLLRKNVQTKYGVGISQYRVTENGLLPDGDFAPPATLAKDSKSLLGFSSLLRLSGLLA